MTTGGFLRVILVLVVGFWLVDSTLGSPPVTALAVTPDGKSLVHGSQAGVQIRSLAGVDEGSVLTGLEQVHALAFSPDGNTLAVAGGIPAESGVVELWSWPGRKRLGQLEGHEDLTYDVAWLDRGKRLATAGADRTVRIWDVASRQCLHTLTGHSGPVLALATSPDGKLLCSGSADQTIRVWDTATFQLVRSLNNHLGTVHALAFRPDTGDGRPAYLASASEDGTVRIWQPGIGRLVRLIRHPTPVYTLAWEASGQRLVSGAKDGRLRTLDGESDAVLREDPLPTGWAASLVVTGSDSLRVAGTSQGVVVVVQAPRGDR